MLERTAQCIATFFYSGKLPKMPGTWGSLAAVPFIPLLWNLPLPFALSIIALIFILGCWAAEVYCRIEQQHDCPQIVIDEVAGIWLTAMIAHGSTANPYLLLVLIFVFFRLFDILKPFPISWFDRRVHGGFGVMLDDIIAAIFALASIAILHYAALFTMGYKLL